MKYIDILKKSVKKERLPFKGLCACVDSLNFEDRKIFFRFSPTYEDHKQIIKDSLDVFYWASGLEILSDKEDLWYKLTDLRINILLFCAAINGEL